MEKSKLFSIIILLLLIVSFVSATRYVIYDFKEGRINADGSITEFSNNLNDVNVFGVVCSNSDCSSISGTLWSGNELTSTGNSIQLSFPTTQANNGYGMYMYKQGYIPWEQKTNWWGTNSNDPQGPYTKYIKKKEVCTSSINSANIQIDGSSVSVHAPINHAGPLDYVPSQLTSHYSTDVNVNLEIRDDDLNIIHSETKSVNMMYSADGSVNFDYTLGPGDYVVKIFTSLEDEAKCMDYNEDSVQKSIHIETPNKVITDVIVTATPDSGIAPLEVDFTCQGVGGDAPLSYNWDLGDGSSSSEQNPTHTYTTPGDYTAVCTVSDSDVDTLSNSVEVEAIKNHLEITDLVCFEHVIENNNQSCSVTVEDSLGNSVPNANVEVFYSDDTSFGSCESDGITGKCTAKDIQTQVGDFEVYATATKTGYISDISKELRFLYTVLEEKYEIEDLKVFSDNLFSIEDYDFFRGEEIFVKFDVTREGELVEGMITKATLVSPTGGRIDLEEFSEGSGTYRFNKIIPLTHDFFGVSDVFTFAFDFVDNSGGQAEVQLTIRNNPPIMGFISDKTLEVDETITIDLSNYESDLEDSGDNLRWEVTTSSIADVDLEGKILTITGMKKGTDTITLTLYDLNNDSDEQELEITVEKEEKKKKRSGGSYHIADICVPIWECSGYSACTDGTRTRQCVDLNECNVLFDQPAEAVGCEDEVIAQSIVQDKGPNYLLIILLISSVLLFAIILTILMRR